MAERVKITVGSGNVFEDLGFPDAEERLVKASLALEIERIIDERSLTQRAAAKMMGIDQPKVSHIVRGQLEGYSIERLMGFLTALGRDIEIVVREAPRSRQKGRVKVVGG